MINWLTGQQIVDIVEKEKKIIGPELYIYTDFIIKSPLWNDLKMNTTGNKCHQSW